MNYYIIYLKEYKALYRQYKRALDAGLKKSRDKQIALSSNLKSFKDTYHECSLYLKKAGYPARDDFFEFMAKTLALDKRLKEPAAFERSHDQWMIPLTEENVRLLAKYKAISSIIDYIKELINPNESDVTIQPNTLQRPNKYWIGTEETEFVQLIYALVEAKRLTEKGKTKMVEEIARFLGFPLSKNWQSNLSKSIHKSKDGYSPSIFDELKPAWEEYTEKREDKMYKPKKKKPID